MNSNNQSLPTLTLNGLFMRDLMDATAPCFGMGLVEVDNTVTGFLAVRPEMAIPAYSTDQGFNFGHSVLGVDNAPVLHFAFDFYDHACFHALVNPGNKIVQQVLNIMIENEDYFFFAINSDNSVMVFRSYLENADLANLKTNQSHFNSVTCLPAQYDKTVTLFSQNPSPSGEMLEWVCRDDQCYLDMSGHRMEMKPRS